MVSGRDIDAESGHHHASQRREHVVFGIDEDVSDSIVREPGQGAIAAVGFPESIHVLVFEAFVRDGDLDAEMIGHTIVQVQRVHLRDGSNLSMMVQNELPIIDVDSGNHTCCAGQQRALRSVVIEPIDGEQSFWRDCLLGSDHHKTGHGPAGGIARRCAEDREEKHR